MTHRDRIRLSAASGFALATIAKWDLGKKIAASSEQSLTDAAKKLGLLEKRLATAGVQNGNS
jgi:hypothetical protein